jgi:hypothetical protein
MFKLQTFVLTGCMVVISAGSFLTSVFIPFFSSTKVQTIKFAFKSPVVGNCAIYSGNNTSRSEKTDKLIMF